MKLEDLKKVDRLITGLEAAKARRETFSQASGLQLIARPTRGYNYTTEFGDTPTKRAIIALVVTAIDEQIRTITEELKNLGVEV